jgi:thiopurine S-methyltransferase
MDRDFWNQRWSDGQTGWDIGYPSPSIVNFFETLENKAVSVLIPGCGNAYEAEQLYNMGFKNVFVIDISELAIESFLKRCPDFPKTQIINGDFFELAMKFDYIIEQTFFCALHPEMREQYCRKMGELLNLKGKLVGLLFDFPLETGPPFGGDREEYQERFSRYFKSVSIEKCEKSIPQRAGREFWIEIALPFSS